MARLKTLGFESDTTTSAQGTPYEWTSPDVGVSGQISTTTSRTGGQSFRSAPAAASDGYYKFLATAGSGPYYGRWYIYVHAAPAANATIASFIQAGVTPVVAVWLKTDLTLQVSDDSGALVGSPTAALSLDTWYRLELSATKNGATNMTAIARLDGAEFFNGVTSATTFTMDAIRWGNSAGVASLDIFYDDIAVNDSSGTVQNSWPGSGKVLYLRPNAAGSVNTYGSTSGSQTGGTAGAANNFTRVDEAPAPDDATSFNGSTTLNEEDFFNMTDSGIGATDTVNVVEVHGRFRDSTADAVQAFKFEIKKSSAGTVAQSAALVPNSTTWRTNAVGTGIRTAPIVEYLDPDGSVAWTQATLDTMQAGYKLTVDGTSTRRIDVTALWVVVDYTPNTGVSATVTQVAATVTAAGGTQTVATVRNATIAQVAATITATGGTQVVSTAVNASIAQIAASVTATGGTQAALRTLTSMATLQDDFEFGGIDTGKWSTWGSTTTNATTNLCLEMTSTLAANYGGTLALGQNNLTGSYALAEIKDAGNQSIPSLEVYPVELTVGSNALSVMISGNTVYARKKVSGSYTTVGSTVAYNSTTMKWVRVRESAGTIYWEYATDPTGTWTLIASLATPFDVTAMTGGSTIGTWQAEGSTTTVKIDNFNVIPASLQFTWKGYTWNKRIHQGDPSRHQIWSGANISAPDVNDYLTVSITNPTGSAPVAAEFFSAQRGFGYGTYTAVVGTRLDNIDQRNAFGNLFLFDFTAPPAYREIDSAEIRNYNSNPNMRILHSHVYDNAGAPTFITDDMDVTADVVQTHRVIWEPGRITFDAFIGAGTGGTNYFHTVHSTNVPAPSLERVHFNIWNNTNVTGYLQAPALDVVIRDFTFVPLSAAIAQVAATVTATGGTQAIATVNNVTVAQLAATVTASGGTQAVSTVKNAAVTQVAATITAAGGTQAIATVNNAAIAQLAAAVTATGGTQTIATINNVAISQLAAVITASGGTQVVSTVRNVAIAQLAATITAAGGAQTISSVQNSAVVQLAAAATASGGVQAVAAVQNATIAQVAATVTAAGGTQTVAAVVIASATITQVAANITASGGAQVAATIRLVAITQSAATITAAGGVQVVTGNGIASAAITQLAASITASGGTQAAASVQNATVAQLAAGVLATGGTQAIAAVRNVAIAQVAAVITATGGLTSEASLQNAAIAQVGASVAATGGVQAVFSVRLVVIAQLAASVTAAAAGPAVVAASILGQIRVWDGSAWVLKYVKVWNGVAWVAKPIKAWTGSTWRTGV